MVVNVYRIILVDSLVNVHLDTVVNDVKIGMVALVNHVKIMVFVSAQVVVHIHANVQQVLKDQLVNNVCRFFEKRNLRMIILFLF